MPKILVAGLAGASLSLLAATASADPGTLTLDRQDGQSRVGGEVSYLLIDGDGAPDVFRFDLHGQYITPSGWGFYAGFPMIYGTGNDESETAIGNIEAGAIFLPRMTNPDVSLPIHVGLTLPTAQDEDVLLNFLGAESRLTDLVTGLPEGVVLRAAVSPTFRSGQFFLRGDGGVDITLSNSGEETFKPLIRVNGAVGFDLGTVSFAGELVTLISTDDDIEDNVLNTLAVGFRAAAGGVRPYGGVVVPLGDGPLGELVEVNASLVAGIEGVIQ